MLLRSHTKLQRERTSDPSGQNNVAPTHQHVRTNGAGHLSKRTRTSSDTSPMQHGQVLDAQTSPVRKKSRRTRPLAGGNVALKSTDLSNIIDPTPEDDPVKKGNGHASQPVPPESGRIRHGGGVRRGGRPAAKKRDAAMYVKSEDRKGKSKALEEEALASTDKACHTHDKNECGTAEVMFTVPEAILFLERHSQGIVSGLTPPYTLKTGERVPFPVTASYHLGGMGRFGNDSSDLSYEESTI